MLSVLCCENNMTNQYKRTYIITSLIVQSLCDLFISLLLSVIIQKLLLHLFLECSILIELQKTLKVLYGYKTYLFLRIYFAAHNLAQDTTFDKTYLLTMPKICIFIITFRTFSQNIAFFTIFYISVIYIYREIAKVSLFLLFRLTFLHFIS